MNNQDENIAESTTVDSTPTAKKKKPLWVKTLRWLTVAVFTVAIVIVSIISVALWYLTPEKLTPIVNEYAGDFIDADAKVGRVELTFWSTFPKLNLQIDSLEIVSRSLHCLSNDERNNLSADADSLLRIERLSGGIDISALPLGNIALYDLEIKNPWANIVVINDSINNFNIFPATTEEETEPTEPFESNLSFNRFELIGSMPIRFRSLTDSIDATLTFNRTEVDNSAAPVYKLDISGNTGLDMTDIKIPTAPFSIDGNLSVDINNLKHVGLSDFTFEMLGIRSDFNADITLTPDLSIDKFNIKFPNIDVAHIIDLIPQDQIGKLKKLDTDLSLSAEAELLEPYLLSSETLPKVKFGFNANAHRLRFEQMNLSKVDIASSGIVDPNNFDRSTIAIERINVVGYAMDFKAAANISHPLSDPRVDGQFSGKLSIDRLPRILLDKLPMTVQGTLRGETDFKFRLSQLSPNKFHHVKLNGKVNLSEFRAIMAQDNSDAYIRNAELKFGSSSNIDIKDRHIDSMLTASLKVDTASFNMPGLQFAGRNLFAGLGMRNVASSSDTTQINPVGGTMRAELISLKADSANTRIRLRDASIGGALQRYNSDARSPQLNLSINARRMSYHDINTRASVSNAKTTIKLHPRKRNTMPRLMQARIDSLSKVYPELTTDSLVVLAQKQMRRKTRTTVSSDRENIDFAVDSSLSSWLQLWRLTGSMTANRASCYTSFYPTRTSLTGLDFKFSTDSVRIANARLKTGKSDFTINGSIKNIRRALTSRRHTPIEISFNVKSDTIDINDMTATLLRGAAYSANIPDSTLLNNSDEDFEEFVSTDSQSDTVMAAVIIPSNIKAELRMNAKKIHYSDMWLNNFGGLVSIYDGALSLNNVHAKTDIGSLNMSAMYSAPTRKNISFATGISINKLNLDKLLGMMPQIDSLMPMLSNVEGIVDAHMALTTNVDSMMNIDFRSLDMALKLSGDSLVLLDSETFRTVAKWLMFKNKKRNMIEHMDVEVMIHDGWLDLYPMMFDMDRYRLGIVGNNDLALNLDYHVAVLKSPLPFKFGINIKGTPEKMKIRLGKARLNEKSVASQRNLTDSLRVNLMSEIQRTFRRGVRTAGTHGLRMQHSAKRATAGTIAAEADTLSSADSALFIREGLIEATQKQVGDSLSTPATKSTKKRKK